MVVTMIKKLSSSTYRARNFLIKKAPIKETSKSLQSKTFGKWETIKQPEFYTKVIKASLVLSSIISVEGLLFLNVGNIGIISLMM